MEGNGSQKELRSLSARAEKFWVSFNEAKCKGNASEQK